jgi:hypothetical protein
MAKRISELPEFVGTPDGTEVAVFNKDGTTYRASYADLLAWMSGGSGTPGGATTQVQFNNAGAFDGEANLTWVTGGGSEGQGALVVSEVNAVESMFGLVLAGKVQAGNDADFPAAVYVTNGSATDGGAVQLSAGNADSTAGNGGSVDIAGGNATVGDGGNLNIQSGGSTSGNGGSVLIQASSGTDNGGSIQMSAGEAPENPGIASLQGGAASGVGGVGASAKLTGGFSNQGNGGTAEVLGGFAQTNGVGGTASLRGGGSVTGEGGLAIVQGGNIGGGGTVGGDVYILGGQTFDNLDRGNICFGTSEAGVPLVEWARFNRTGEYVSLRRNVDCVQHVPYAATITIDAASGDEFHIGVLTGACAITVTNPVEGQHLRIRYKQDATGGRALTFATPTLDPTITPVTAANAVGWLTLRYVLSETRYEMVG